jgi:hypothetical protein
MRVLLVLQYPGYLRYFDSVVAELVARGHEVRLIFDRIDKQTEGLAALENAPAQVVVDRQNFPRRNDRWKPLAQALRGTVDYLRYLDPLYANSPYLRHRIDHLVPRGLGFLKRMGPLPKPVAVAALRGAAALERVIPSSARVEAKLRQHAPDLVVVSPLVNPRSWQTDVVKSAKALGIPVALAVGSWDHLTSKGYIRALPDRIFVWNETQREEAFTLHAVPRERVVVTGAQPFEKWFGRNPKRSREAFLEMVGLRPDKPFVLFTGSTASISRPDTEIAFLRRWVEAIRSSGDPALADVGLLIRPHPYNSAHWEGADFEGLGNTVVFPRTGMNIVAEDNREIYLESIAYSAAVVGINTSAMVEATIFGKPVLTVRDPVFADTQDGTVHFKYLLPENGGFLLVAPTLEEHVRQLAGALADPAARQPILERFVRSFLRPDPDRSATQTLVDGLEDLAARRPAAKVRPGGGTQAAGTPLTPADGR